MAYWVFLMPDNRVVAKRTTSEITPDERDAIDCWYTEATSEDDAIGRVFTNVYHSVQRLLEAPQRPLEAPTATQPQE